MKFYKKSSTKKFYILIIVTPCSFCLSVYLIQLKQIGPTHGMKLELVAWMPHDNALERGSMHTTYSEAVLRIDTIQYFYNLSILVVA